MLGTRIRHLPLEEWHQSKTLSIHDQPGIKEILSATSHRPWPLPSGTWAMTQRWNDLLFAHWPIPAAAIAHLIPPVWMDRIRLHGMPLIPGASRFPELNLRTYVRERHSNFPGVFFFSLDAANPAAVLAARALFRLPYFWAHMNIDTKDGREFHYQSTRLLTLKEVRFRATYRSLAQPSTKGGLESFLTERYCLYTTDKHGTLYRGNIHHLPWPLEMAEADIEINELPQAHGIHLPDTQPLFHYAREMVVYIWQLELLPALAKHATTVAVPVAKPL